MTYPECVQYLADLGHELHGMKFSLEPISQILEQMGSPHLRYPTAIVAGTNGKGSTCAMLASILERAGYRTALYTSPHLVRVNERMRVNGVEISDQDFAAAFTKVSATVDRLISERKLLKRPSFFEFLTATAFLYFAHAEAQFVVLEVGMGGRLDATNVTQPRVAIITNIDFDHVEFLGRTLETIAAEKAGVIKPHGVVISGVDDSAAAEVIRRRAQECEAELLEVANVDLGVLLGRVHGRYTFDLYLREDRFARLTSPLLGKFQVKNTIAAVVAAWRLSKDGFKIPRRAVVQGLRAATWPGRLETICGRPLVLIDGGHNPCAARALAAFIREELPGRRLRMVYASMRDKAMGEIGEILFPLAEEVILTHPDQTRAATAEEILAALPFRPPSLHVEPDPAKALVRACASSHADDVVLAFGSLFLVGAIKKALGEGTLRLPNSHSSAAALSAR
jgi:dihydrofolate synthase/folylpolyglutamate synthase